jgi:hypothetical protein
LHGISSMIVGLLLNSAKSNIYYVHTIFFGDYIKCLTRSHSVTRH